MQFKIFPVFAPRFSSSPASGSLPADVPTYIKPLLPSGPSNLNCLIRVHAFRLLLLPLLAALYLPVGAQTKIDRKALVERHKVVNVKADALSSLSVGNGKFAFTVDVTGLQSFPLVYERG